MHDRSIASARQPGRELEAFLDDGRRVLFRRILPSDKARLERGLQMLSEESKYRRFFRHIDHFSEDQLRYLTEVDFIDHYALLAVLPDEPGEPGIAVGRWIRLRDEPSVAEGAVTVIDSHQGQGIGKTMLWLLAGSASPRGIRSFRAWVIGENRPMLELLEGLGAHRGRWESGVLELTIPLPADPKLLEGTPAPLVLRAAARGDLEGHAHPQRIAGTRFVEPAESDSGPTPE